MMQFSCSNSHPAPGSRDLKALHLLKLGLVSSLLCIVPIRVSSCESEAVFLDSADGEIQEQGASMGQVGSAGVVSRGESDGSNVGRREEVEVITISSDVEVSVSMSDEDAGAEVQQPALLLPQATIPLTLPTVGDALQMPASDHPQSSSDS